MKMQNMLLGTVLAFWVLMPSPTLRAGQAPARTVNVTLARGQFPIHAFAPPARARRIILFGTGDGGWSPWEEKVCAQLAQDGNYVMGIDFRDYAKTDYDLPTLQKDTATMLVAADRELGQLGLPVILGGWSMGAAQAVPMAVTAEILPRVQGLLLIAPCERGRYGLRKPDELGILPTGDGTFALGDFGAELKNVPVAQFHGERDFLDSTAWLEGLEGIKQLTIVPGVWHDFDHASDDFISELQQSLDWLEVKQRAMAVSAH